MCDDYYASSVLIDNVMVSSNYNNVANKVIVNKAVNFIYILDTGKIDSTTLEDSELQNSR
ncbi:MAG: hypothetical protein ACTS85_03785 [Arsenophonus sp. NC-PG7-MAG3]